MRRRRWIAILVAALVVGLAACSHQGDSLVLSADGSRLSSEEIDKDPLALLPANAVGVVHIDAQAAFASPIGAAVVALAASAIPVGPDANLDVKRDIRRAIVGLYSLQGADVAAVVQGSFDPDAISASVVRGTPTILGAPLAKLSYAGNDLFVAGGVGFVVVTRHTVLAGNETGIRRALDRIREKRLRRELPEWMVQLVENPKASVVGAADLTSQPQVSAVAQQMPFLNGLRVARVLGNFEPPGINFAGALTYPDPATAAQAGASVQRIAQLASYSALLALLGINPPIRDMQAKVEQNDVQFIVAVDAQGASAVMDALSQAMRASVRK